MVLPETVSTPEIIRATVAALGIVGVSWMLQDNVRSWQAMRRAVVLGKARAWSPDYWIAFSNLVGCAMNCLVWLGLATLAAIALLTPPPATADWAAVAGAANWLLIVVQLLLACVQGWQIFTRTMTRRARRALAAHT